MRRLRNRGPFWSIAPSPNQRTIVAHLKFSLQFHYCCLPSCAPFLPFTSFFRRSLSLSPGLFSQPGNLIACLSFGASNYTRKASVYSLGRLPSKFIQIRTTNSNVLLSLTLELSCAWEHRRRRKAPAPSRRPKLHSGNKGPPPSPSSRPFPYVSTPLSTDCVSIKLIAYLFDLNESMPMLTSRIRTWGHSTTPRPVSI